MARSIIECVPNFSEGRDQRVVEAIAEAIRLCRGAALLAYESDPDHHRSVFTIVGPPEPVLQAAFQAVATAAERIDLNRHRGVHPRIGAADVVPLVPVHGISLEECARLAHSLGERIWRELRIPVYFYEAAAKSPERRNLEQIRRGGFERLRQEIASRPERLPDVGEASLHPTAGAVAVGARKFLIAFNVNLATRDVTVATAIARKVRSSSGGLPHVKAMGVYLESRGMAQVSMNLTDYEVTSLDAVMEAVREEASRLGVAIAGSEIVGLAPAGALAGCVARYLDCRNYKPEMILENQLLRNLLDCAQEDSPCPTGGDS